MRCRLTTEPSSSVSNAAEMTNSYRNKFLHTKLPLSPAQRRATQKSPN